MEVESCLIRRIRTRTRTSRIRTKTSRTRIRTRIRTRTKTSRTRTRIRIRISRTKTDSRTTTIPSNQQQTIGKRTALFKSGSCSLWITDTIDSSIAFPSNMFYIDKRNDGGDKMKPEINKQIELIQVLLYLADMQDYTRQVISNKTYCRVIDKYFAPFREHAAVKLTRRKIREEAFFHIRPLCAVLALDALIRDEGDPQHDWALQVQQFIRDTDFDYFFKTQSDYYNWIKQAIGACNFDGWISCIETYFRQKPARFHLIICPIAGNYGFSMPEKRGAVSYVVRCMPYYNEDGIPLWDFDAFAKGIAHEYGHCFVNPVVEAHREILCKYRSFFERHTNIPAAYNVDYAVMNEYWVRAFAIRFMEKNEPFFPAFDITAEYRRQRESFIYIDSFVELLKDFEQCCLPFETYYLRNIENIIA